MSINHIQYVKEKGRSDITNKIIKISLSLITTVDSTYEKIICLTENDSECHNSKAQKLTLITFIRSDYCNEIKG